MAAGNIFKVVSKKFYGKKQKKYILGDDIICNFLDEEYCPIIEISEISEKINKAGISIGELTIIRRIKMLKLTKRYLISSEDEKSSILREYSNSEYRRMFLTGIINLLEIGITSWEHLELLVGTEMVKKNNVQVDEIAIAEKKIITDINDYFIKVRRSIEKRRMEQNKYLDQAILLSARSSGINYLVSDAEKNEKRVKELEDEMVLLRKKYEDVCERLIVAHGEVRGLQKAIQKIKNGGAEKSVRRKKTGYNEVAI